MLRRVAVLTVLVAVAGLTTVVLSTPAAAVGISSSDITSPASGAHYLITDVQPPTTVTVSGTTSGGAVGDLVDIRCYTSAGRWETAAAVQSIPIDAGGHFTAQMPTDMPYGTCALRAVPHDYAATGSLAAFTGPKVTSEYVLTRKILTGPHAGMAYDYYVEYVSKYAMNDYHSATDSGLQSARLQHADGTSSNTLWNGGGSLARNEDGTRSFLRVDGRDAYGPYTAAVLFVGSNAIPGLPALTYSATRNSTTGTTTIRETDPIVVCPDGTPFPPTPVSCPQFQSAGVRLERTIVATDGGRQVHITDRWRSTDGKAHALSAHYGEAVDGHDYSTGAWLTTLVGLKLPWANTAYQTFSSAALVPGPAKVPASLYVRDDMAAADGNANFPRGALTFDVAPSKVDRGSFRTLTLRDEGIKVPAGGTRLVRRVYVIGTTQSVVNAKAAANEKRINPYRADGMIKRSGTTYQGNNVYNTTGIKQTATAVRQRGTRAVFDIKVQNDGTAAADSFTIKGSGGTTAYGVRYLAGLTGSTDITTAVKNGTYAVKNLAPGATRFIRLVVTVKSAAGIGTVRTWLVTTTSTHDGTRRDAVKAQVRVASR